MNKYMDRIDDTPPKRKRGSTKLYIKDENRIKLANIHERGSDENG